MRIAILSLAAACATFAGPFVPAARAEVYVTAPVHVHHPLRPWRHYAPVPVYDAPAYYGPRPAYYAPVAHGCTTRVVRVWTGNRYASRRVTRCY
jgi:hypothetical protein